MPENASSRWSGGPVSEKSKDLVLGLCILAFALGGFVFVNPTGAPVTEGPGGLSWRTLPLIYSGLLLALAVVFLAATLLGASEAVGGRSDGPADRPATADGGSGQAAIETGPPGSRAVPAMRRVGVVVCLLAYSQALGAFGFALSTPVFLLALLYLFGRRDARENLLVSIVGGGVLWVLFAYLLRMPLRGDVWDPVTPALLSGLRALGA